MTHYDNKRSKHAREIKEVLINNRVLAMVKSLFGVHGWEAPMSQNTLRILVKKSLPLL